MEKETNAEGRHRSHADALAARLDGRDDVRVRAGAARCPYCHTGVSADRDDWVACRACLARHHATCWREARRCAACRADRSVSPERRTLPVLAAIVAVILLGWAWARSRGREVARAQPFASPVSSPIQPVSAPAPSPVPPPAARPEPTPEAPRTPETEGETPHRWWDVPVGSVAEGETVDESDGRTSVMGFRWTLVARTPRVATLREEVLRKDCVVAPREQRIDFVAPWTKYEMDVWRGCGIDEKVPGPLGDLTCRALVYEDVTPPLEGGREREEIWFAPRIPVPVKSILYLPDQGRTVTWTLRRFVRGKG